jgi:hypothetical protein
VIRCKIVSVRPTKKIRLQPTNSGDCFFMDLKIDITREATFQFLHHWGICEPCRDCLMASWLIQALTLFLDLSNVCAAHTTSPSGILFQQVQLVQCAYLYTLYHIHTSMTPSETEGRSTHYGLYSVCTAQRSSPNVMPNILIIKRYTNTAPEDMCEIYN